MAMVKALMLLVSTLLPRNLEITPRNPHAPNIQPILMPFLPSSPWRSSRPKSMPRRLSLRPLVPRFTRYWDQNEHGHAWDVYQCDVRHER